MNVTGVYQASLYRVPEEEHENVVNEAKHRLSQQLCKVATQNDYMIEPDTFTITTEPKGKFVLVRAEVNAISKSALKERKRLDKLTDEQREQARLAHNEKRRARYARTGK